LTATSTDRLPALLLNPEQQFRVVDSEKAWTVVALRNFGSPAFVGIDHADAPAMFADINRGQ
jgi:hypothetical protein